MRVTHVASIILCAAGVLHLLRGIMGWQVTIETRSFPIWLSFVGGVVLLGVGVSVWCSPTRHR